MTAVTTPHPREWPLSRPAAAARHRQWRWLAVGLVLAFLIPYVLTDLVSINRDLYYGIYILAVFSFVGAWIGCANDSPRAVLTRNWRAGVGVGVVFVGAMVAIVLNEPATSRPDGLEFIAAVVWRGMLYGLADGLILSAFPILATFAAFAGTRTLTRWRGKVGVGALALAASLLFTAVYHLGYADFRGEKLRKPVAGDVIWSVPTLATLSPFGAPIAHAGLHVSAVVHSYETDIFLPPHKAAIDGAPLQALLDLAAVGPDRLAPGVTAHVATPDGTWSGAAGLADVVRGTATPTDARMRLESVSKIWTATLIYRLAEDGNGFDILGAIAARASRQNLPALYRERIFAPLGLEQTAYDTRGPIFGPHAHAYSGRALTDVSAVHPGVGAEGGIDGLGHRTVPRRVDARRPARSDALAKMKTGFWSAASGPVAATSPSASRAAPPASRVTFGSQPTGSRIAILLLNGRGDASARRKGLTMSRRRRGR